MDIQSFLNRRGFISGDPFAHTNSEQEERLDEYFIPPPYFQTVMGDAHTPKTSVVFAPRGSGKTAQRLMLEKRAQASGANFLCLTYDSFGAVQQSSGSLESHHIELCRLLTIACLSVLEDDDIEVIYLSEHERQVLKAASHVFIGGLGLGEYRTAVQSVKTIGDKAADFWAKYGGPVAVGLAILMKKVGLDDVELNVTLAAQANDANRANASYFLRQLIDIAIKLGRFDAVYFLVDKIDEMPWTTNNAEASADLIKDLITDLPTMEAPHVAFKFFLWDQVNSYLQEDGLRPDRLEVVRLGWTARELSSMLERRLSAFSENVVHSFDNLMDQQINFSAHAMLVYLSHGSPRDMIRMARAVVSEHTRLFNEDDYISENSFWRGVASFSRDSTNEKYAKFSSDLRKLGQASFSIPDIAGVFKISTTGASNKVQAWSTSGAVRSLGTRPNPGAKPLNLYGYADPRVLIASAARTDYKDLLDSFVFQCGSCRELVISREESIDCPACGSLVGSSVSLSLVELVARPG